MPLYEFGTERLSPLESTAFSEVSIRERGDLQRLLRDQIDVLVPDAMVIAEEFGDWDASSRRIDILALDRTGDLIVVELKRTDDGGHMELQAIRYAAMISTMTWAQAVDAHRDYLQTRGLQEDPQTRMLTFLEQDEPREEFFNQDVKIVLASAGFKPEITTAVLWLNSRGIDIRCVQLLPYRFRDQILVDVQQIIPLREAEEYQVRVRVKESQARASRQEASEGAARVARFFEGLQRRVEQVPSLGERYWYQKSNRLESRRNGTVLVFIVSVSGEDNRVQLYLGPKHAEKKRSLYDFLASHRAEIGAKCPGALSWNGDDPTSPITIELPVNGGSFKDEGNWDALQKAMIDTMMRFEAALSPLLESYDRA